MKTKKGKSLIDNLYKSNPGAIELLDLVSRYPLKDPIEIITKTSGWKIIKNHPVTDKGIASFAVC